MGGGKGGNQVFHENAVFEVSSFVSAGTHRFCSIHIHLHAERARERDDNNAHSPRRRGSSWPLLSFRGVVGDRTRRATCTRGALSDSAIIMDRIVM